MADQQRAAEIAERWRSEKSEDIGELARAYLAQEHRLREGEEALAHTLYRNHEFSHGCTPCVEAQKALSRQDGGGGGA